METQSCDWLGLRTNQHWSGGDREAGLQNGTTASHRVASPPANFPRPLDWRLVFLDDIGESFFILTTPTDFLCIFRVCFYLIIVDVFLFLIYFSALFLF